MHSRVVLSGSCQDVGHFRHVTENSGVVNGHDQKALVVVLRAGTIHLDLHRFCSGQVIMLGSRPINPLEAVKLA